MKNTKKRPEVQADKIRKERGKEKNQPDSSLPKFFFGPPRVYFSFTLVIQNWRGVNVTPGRPPPSPTDTDGKTAHENILSWTGLIGGKKKESSPESGKIHYFFNADPRQKLC